ncbi:hypothetical protein M3Y99_00814600 [Aphelenchoides fujianensis]|nr:hypothetical protein M3Y99_00814600 [Aphelenchoides fujianensis]
MTSRLRKKDVANFYKNRAELTDAQAADFFCHAEILGAVDAKGHSTEGLKLNVYLLLERLGVEKAWEAIRRAVVLQAPSPRLCELIGRTLKAAWTAAREDEAAYGEAGGRPAVRKAEIAAGLFAPLLSHCVLVKRKHADRFVLILKAAVEERKHDFARMLFAVSEPLVWRYLTCPNWHIRAGAFAVQTAIFPPVCEDPIRQQEFTLRHCESFEQGLQDETVEIAVQQLEAVCEAMAFWVKEFSAEWVARLFAALERAAADEVADIRARTFAALRHLVACPDLVKPFEELLQRICPHGIDDQSDRVRCNTFRLLNHNIKVITNKADPAAILELDPVLYRLDFEEAEAVEREIVTLLHGRYFADTRPTRLFSRVMYFGKVSRAACLELHRLFMSARLLTVDEGLVYVRSVLEAALRALKRLLEAFDAHEAAGEADGDEPADEDAEEDDEEHSRESGRPSKRVLEKKMAALKTVVDAMVVLFTCIRGDAAFNAADAEAMHVAHLFTRFVDDVLNADEGAFTGAPPRQPGLFNSAFAIMAMLRNGGQHVSRVVQGTIRMLRAGHLDPKYLETAALLDMEKMLATFKSGLRQIQKTSKSAEAKAALVQRGARNNSDFFSNERVVIRALDATLAAASCRQYVLDTYAHVLDDFVKLLGDVCDNFARRLRDGEELEDFELFAACFESANTMRVLKHHRDTRDAEEPPAGRKRARGAAAPRRSALLLAELDEETRTDPLLDAVHWFQRHFGPSERLAAHAPFVELFFAALNVHFRAYKHRRAAVVEAQRMLESVHERYQALSAGHSLAAPFAECRANGQHALEFALEDRARSLFQLPEEDENEPADAADRSADPNEKEPVEVQMDDHSFNEMDPL